MKEEIIGTIKKFKGTFDVYRTANVFDFIEQTPKDILEDIKDDVTGDTLFKQGRINPRAEINGSGMIVEILNDKEGLFTCQDYPLTSFKFQLSNL